MLRKFFYKSLNVPISLCGIAGLAGGPGSGTSLWDLLPGFSLAAGAWGGTSCVKVLPSWICWKLRRKVSPPGAWTIDDGSPANAGSSSSFSLPLYR